MDQYNQQYSTYAVDTKSRINALIQSVYLWMAGALVVSGVISYALLYSADLLSIFINLRTGHLTPVSIGCIIAWFIVGFGFRPLVYKLPASIASALLIVFAALTAIFLAPVLLAYTRTSVASTFFICAATFAAASFFGFITKRNLMGLGHFFLMGLIGIIIASLVNIFLYKSFGMYMIIGYIGVLLFVGLTAYSTQKMKNTALAMPEDATPSMIRKMALLNAFELYLNFVNLFLYLLRILGSRN